MKAFVAVTDRRWIEVLSADPDIRQANFWQPSPNGSFAALAVGEPFLFKTHYPDNMLVGGGYFDRYTIMSVSAAWDQLGACNGADSLREMRERIGRYRRSPIGPQEDPDIGCVLLADVRFLPRTDRISAPGDFAKNIVRGKTYRVGDGSSASVEAVLASLVKVHAPARARQVDGPMFGAARPVKPRLGQQAFKFLVQDAYHSRCAVSGSRITPVLQAAHIRPVTAGGEHRVDNGLLLRSDVHLLFDRGYLGVTPGEYRLRVSPRLRTRFRGGDEFYSLADQRIGLPDDSADHPSHEMLEWHLDTVFQS